MHTHTHTHININTHTNTNISTKHTNININININTNINTNINMCMCNFAITINIYHLLSSCSQDGVHGLHSITPSGVDPSSTLDRRSTDSLIDRMAKLHKPWADVVREKAPGDTGLDTTACKDHGLV